MAIELSTAGIKLGWGVETVKNAQPSTFTRVRGIKSIPSLNPAPETIETTDLSQTEWKTYIDGLKDLGGALEFTCNLTNELMDDWDDIMTEYESATSNELRMWFIVWIPKLSKSFFFVGNPSPLGMPEAAVSSVLETSVFITPVDVPGWAAKVAVAEPA